MTQTLYAQMNKKKKKRVGSHINCKPIEGQAHPVPDLP
jgi:hypothetical protein